ncbi:MAG: DNA polymerase III subunit epsilon [Methylophilaceae bacterium]|jgi:DNA polymerase-3 subunit epsilon|nr:DNA polymerase III subunit epsilon [Methylophilaceae bacterium]
MRQIFLDTETTGLYPDQGHRIIEIACVETINRRPTGNHFHKYLNPEREIDVGAQDVHGITLEFLQDKPLFKDLANDFLAFIQGSELIIHNAPFDIGFLNSELGKLGLPQVTTVCDSVTDTLKMAKDARPGQRNNLDALCRHFQIDNSRRVLHGALLDAELLAEVYMALTRGQDSLMIDLEHGAPSSENLILNKGDVKLRVLMADEAESAAHDAYLAGLGDIEKSSW